MILMLPLVTSRLQKQKRLLDITNIMLCVTKLGGIQCRRENLHLTGTCCGAVGLENLWLVVKKFLLKNWRLEEKSTQKKSCSCGQCLHVHPSFSCCIQGGSRNLFLFPP